MTTVINAIMPKLPVGKIIVVGIDSSYVACSSVHRRKPGGNKCMPRATLEALDIYGMPRVAVSIPFLFLFLFYFRLLSCASNKKWFE